VSLGATAGEIERAYEAVRAQANGMVPQIAPRGLALILDAGVAAWISSWSSLTRTETATLAPARVTSAFDPERAELASVLTEMALASRRCPA